MLLCGGYRGTTPLFDLLYHKPAKISSGWAEIKAEGLVLACGLGLARALTEAPKARQARFGEPRRQPPARHSLPRRFKPFPFMPEGEKQKAIARAMTFHFCDTTTK